MASFSLPKPPKGKWPPTTKLLMWVILIFAGTFGSVFALGGAGNQAPTPKEPLERIQEAVDAIGKDVKDIRTEQSSQSSKIAVLETKSTNMEKRQDRSDVVLDNVDKKLDRLNDALKRK